MSWAPTKLHRVRYRVATTVMTFCGRFVDSIYAAVDVGQVTCQQCRKAR